MSMHEFEDLVEMSVRVLDACGDAGSADLRSTFHHLYEFQAMWDTSFTHFRVMDILVKHRFVYRMDMADHPDYAQYQPTLDQVVQASKVADSSHSVHFLRLDPTRELDRETLRKMSWQEQKEWNLGNPVVGYYRYPYLYADAGSPLWRKLVETGRLSGVDAAPPDAELSLVTTADRVVRCAEGQQHYEVMTLWYALLPVYLAYKNASERVITPALESFIATINRSDALKRAVEQHPYLEQFTRAFLTVSTAVDYLAALEGLMGGENDL